MRRLLAIVPLLVVLACGPLAPPLLSNVTASPPLPSPQQRSQQNQQDRQSGQQDGQGGQRQQGGQGGQGGRSGGQQSQQDTNRGRDDSSSSGKR